MSGRARARTHTHTHTHAHTLTRSHAHSLSHTHTHTQTQTQTHTDTDTHTHRLTHTHTHTLSHTHSHTLTLSLTHSHTHTLSLTHTHTHTHSRVSGNWFYKRRRALCKQCIYLRSQTLFHESEAALCERVFLCAEGTRAQSSSAARGSQAEEAVLTSRVYSWKKHTMRTLFRDWLWMLVSAEQSQLSPAAPVWLFLG